MGAEELLVGERGTLTIPISTHPGRELNEGHIIWQSLINTNGFEGRVYSSKEQGKTIPDSFMKVAHSSTHFILGCGRRATNLICAECSLDLDFGGDRKRKEKTHLIRKTETSTSSTRNQNVFVEIKDA
jgi:hypothetical protein